MSMGNGPVRNLLFRIRGETKKSDTVIVIYYRLPSQ